MKKILLSIFLLLTTLSVLPFFAAFEAHIINVTAQIENSLLVPISDIRFGTVFPQERFDRTIDVSLSQSFRTEPRVSEVSYHIRQKPKCGLPIPDRDPAEYSAFGVVTEDAQGNLVCLDQGYEILPLLCPYLSKAEISVDGNRENDGPAKPPFHGLPGPWTATTTVNNQVVGLLSKAGGDFNDTWNIDLKVPCFGGHCAQDWDHFVKSFNSHANPAHYIQDPTLEHELFGCDLWLEVSDVSATSSGKYVLFAEDFGGTYQDLLNRWVRSYPQAPQTPNLDDDVAINSTFITTARFADLEDNAAIETSVDTTGYENIILSYQRRTRSAASPDRLRVEWRIGNSGPFIQLEETVSTTITWFVKQWALAGADNQSEIQIRFFMNAGPDDFGMVDSVVIMGDPL